MNIQFHGIMLDVNGIVPTLINITTGQEGDDKKPMIIYDLDGTIANDSKRKKHLTDKDQKDFDAYMKDIPSDEPHWPVIEQLVKDYKGGAVIVLLTGRSDDYLSKTLRQIHKFQIAEFVSSLIMRSHGDYRPAAEFKESAIGLLVGEGAVVAGIVDDDASVRAMAAELGIEGIDPADIIEASKAPKIILPGQY